ncbi:hypothetical protein TNCV_4547541 [Trichonephila clavipes]|nr:hypothetical protein TNCV_4547541 [Trichonephila clavipes]
MSIRLQHDAQLINRSDWRLVTNLSATTSQTFSINEKSVSRVAAAIVSDLRVHAAANIVELFVQTLVVLQTTHPNS